jgi:predicted component of type VI protein secretion system
MSQMYEEQQLEQRFQRLRFLTEKFLNIEINHFGEFLREKTVGLSITRNLLRLLNSEKEINTEVSC